MEPPKEIYANGFKQVLRNSPPNVSAAVYHPLPLSIDSGANSNVRISTEWPERVSVFWNFFDDNVNREAANANPVKKIPDRFQDYIPTDITLAEFLHCWDTDQPNLNGPKHWFKWDYAFYFNNKPWDQWNKSFLELIAEDLQHVKYTGLVPNVAVQAVKRADSHRQLLWHFHFDWEETAPSREWWPMSELLQKALAVIDQHERLDLLKILLQWGRFGFADWPQECAAQFDIPMIIAYAPTIEFALKWMKSRLVPPSSPEWFRLLLHGGLEHWRPKDWDYFCLCVDVEMLVTVFPSVYPLLPERVRRLRNVIREMLRYNGCMLIHLPRKLMINPGYQVLALQQRPTFFPYLSTYMTAPLIFSHPVVQAVHQTTKSWYEPILDRHAIGGSSSGSAAKRPNLGNTASPI